MAEHNWVAHIVIPVTPMDDPMGDEGFVVLHNEEQLKKAILTAPMGCENCDEPLGFNSVRTTCSGAKKVDPSP